MMQDAPDPRPCPYCWGFTPPEGWSMENVDQYMPEGGFAEIHPECQASVDAYEEERAEERRLYGVAL
jgi:hypothetical protein